MQEEISKHRGNGQVRICPSSVVSEQRNDADGVQGVTHHTTCDISGFSAMNDQGHRVLWLKRATFKNFIISFSFVSLWTVNLFVNTRFPLITSNFGRLKTS